MTATTEQTTVVRTGRGLVISGSRLTLYTLIDHLRAGWPPSLIQQWFQLSDAQMTDILSYLDTHRDEVEREYQQVIAQAESQRLYWQARNQDRVAQPDLATLTPEQRAIWEKLQEWKGRIPPL